MQFYAVSELLGQELNETLQQRLKNIKKAQKKYSQIDLGQGARIGLEKIKMDCSSTNLKNDIFSNSIESAISITLGYKTANLKLSKLQKMNIIINNTVTNLVNSQSNSRFLDIRACC